MVVGVLVRRLKRRSNKRRDAYVKLLLQLLRVILRWLGLRMRHQFSGYLLNS